VRRNAARAIANLVETTLAMPVSADIFKISRRLRSPIEQVAIAALLKIRSRDLVIAALNWIRDPQRWIRDPQRWI